MLIYAIVLILVMLATNNPTLRAIFDRIFRRGQTEISAEAQRGGAEQ